MMAAWLFEKYDEAFHYLKRNIKKLGITNVQAVQHDITLGYDDKIFETPDLIVSNPPYLRTDELGGLSTEVMSLSLRLTAGRTASISIV